MKINSDFTKRVVVRLEDYKWQDSPIAGVERMMLDRIGGEVARATTIVRYAPNSYFSSHRHGGGEEIFVLDGIFGDEHGEYPAGTYLRNPIGTEHTPKIGKEGAVIFVKLHQFSTEDKEQIAIDTLTEPWLEKEKYKFMPLHNFEEENVALLLLDANCKPYKEILKGGAEIFVLEGTIHDEEGSYPKGTWIRLPHMSEQQIYTKDQGAKIYIKKGHLPQN
ncbi:cupin domain-containing protein [Candidatus Uabimicrobium amorphum]|uniref:ChrR-like cupin domain-containing protein n=1 Tax=Uabimicrobium amorphum TaxID=2596890 RepID=A0A5S9F447_UABAM|nr:cupin domain-containing protein [Candidatus Uabimicrobium amorphum]BBM85178.1 hypothetical protein UABAM_03541 [Candidatus Uabimicrobium amorphum]